MANLKLRIKEVAKEHGLSIAQLADRLGVKAQSLSQAVYRNSFTIDKLGEIADVIGVEVPELFESYAKPSTDIKIETVCPHCGKRIKVVICQAD